MKKYIYLVLLTFPFVYSCGESEKDVSKDENGFYKTEVPTANVLRVGIKQLEDSLMELSKKPETKKQLTIAVQQTLLEKLKLMYRAYPKDKDAARSVERVYQLYSTMELHHLSVQYADSLVQKYPKYENGMLALESNAVYYDMQVEPRDKEKVKYYYEALIKNYPNAEVQRIEGWKSRLENIDLSWLELIEKQN